MGHEKQHRPMEHILRDLGEVSELEKATAEKRARLEQELMSLHAELTRHISNMTAYNGSVS